MKSVGKASLAATFAGLVLLGTGCSGINAPVGVSPATFLLPGLVQAQPPVSPAPDTFALPLPESANSIAESN